MREALSSSGSYKSHTTSIPENGILHSHRRENVKSCIFKTFFWGCESDRDVTKCMKEQGRKNGRVKGSGRAGCVSV
jgi:hypothetical protein